MPNTEIQTHCFDFSSIANSTQYQTPVRSFRGKYIKLPIDGENMYAPEAFVPQDWGRGIELVHLRDDLYYEYAIHILRYISTNLGLWL